MQPKERGMVPALESAISLSFLLTGNLRWVSPKRGEKVLIKLVGLAKFHANYYPRLNGTRKARWQSTYFYDTYYKLSV